MGAWTGVPTSHTPTNQCRSLAEAERADVLRRSLPEEQSRPEAGAVESAMATDLLGLGRGSEARTRAAVTHDACLAAFGPNHRRIAEARELLDCIIDGA
ncbi:hypothetical protein [Streptomyces sp. NPDC052036]|uniref:hypothetical protein n=1 Tax=unclassified Streptomyces TaxID=2593676 RepID=UPI00341A99BF